MSKRNWEKYFSKFTYACQKMELKHSDNRQYLRWIEISSERNKNSIFLIQLIPHRVSAPSILVLPDHTCTNSISQPENCKTEQGSILAIHLSRIRNSDFVTRRVTSAPKRGTSEHFPLLAHIRLSFRFPVITVAPVVEQDDISYGNLTCLDDSQFWSLIAVSCLLHSLLQRKVCKVL